MQKIQMILTPDQISLHSKAFVYILSNKANSTLYIGVTSNLSKRIYEHKNKLTQGFTQKYHCDKIMYFEGFDDIKEAIEREKYLKGKKENLKKNLSTVSILKD